MFRTMSAALALCATSAFAEPVVTAFSGTYDDATFAVENAIINRGLVIDHISHVGDMLNRTGQDVGSDTVIFNAAQVFLFCSAVISREVMEANPMNIEHCPYGIFVAEGTDGVIVGYRDMPEGPMQKVEDLLASIVAEATAE